MLVGHYRASSGTVPSPQQTSARKKKSLETLGRVPRCKQVELETLHDKVELGEVSGSTMCKSLLSSVDSEKSWSGVDNLPATLLKRDLDMLQPHLKL